MDEIMRQNIKLQKQLKLLQEQVKDMKEEYKREKEDKRLKEKLKSILGKKSYKRSNTNLFNIVMNISTK